MPPLEKRMRRAAEVAAHPAIAISAAEAAFRTRYTADLIRILKVRAAATRFVWIMGGDNLSQFDRWDRWRDIAAGASLASVSDLVWTEAAIGFGYAILAYALLWYFEADSRRRATLETM